MPVIKVSDCEDLAKILQKAGLDDKPVWIKVNWTSPDRGMFTEPATLKRILSVISRPVTLLESYSIGRVNGPLDELPDNEQDYIQAMRNADRRFLKTTGIDEILKMPSVSYFNLTEAINAGEAAPAHEVKEIVTSAVEHPINFPELYNHVPQNMYRHRGKVTLLNLARMKVPAVNSGDWSLVLKNMFGLITTPDRRKFHKQDLVGAILDINCIYRSLFNVVDVVEALNSAVIYGYDGQYKAPWGNYDLYTDETLVAYDTNPVLLELAVAEYFDKDLSDRTLIRRAKEIWPL